MSGEICEKHDDEDATNGCRRCFLENYQFYLDELAGDLIWASNLGSSLSYDEQKARMASALNEKIGYQLKYLLDRHGWRLGDPAGGHGDTYAV